MQTPCQNVWWSCMQFQNSNIIIRIISMCCGQMRPKSYFLSLNPINMFDGHKCKAPDTQCVKSSGGSTMLSGCFPARNPEAFMKINGIIISRIFQHTTHKLVATARMLSLSSRWPKTSPHQHRNGGQNKQTKKNNNNKKLSSVLCRNTLIKHHSLDVLMFLVNVEWIDQFKRECEGCSLWWKKTMLTQQNVPTRRWW